MPALLKERSQKQDSPGQKLANEYAATLNKPASIHSQKQRYSAKEY
jgi:hypothetical protein